MLILHVFLKKVLEDQKTSTDRLVYFQLSLKYWRNYYQCGFGKGYNAQHCLLAMIEKWKKAVDNGNVFGALLTDLSKAFNCLPHDLIIAKLYLYGFNSTARNLIHNYLTKRKQRTKINHSHSSWEDILFGVPQGSILDPIFQFFLIYFKQFILNS